MKRIPWWVWIPFFLIIVPLGMRRYKEKEEE